MLKKSFCSLNCGFVAFQPICVESAQETRCCFLGWTQATLLLCCDDQGPPLWLCCSHRDHPGACPGPARACPGLPGACPGLPGACPGPARTCPDLPGPARACPGPARGLPDPARGLPDPARGLPEQCIHGNASTAMHPWQYYSGTTWCRTRELGPRPGPHRAP